MRLSLCNEVIRELPFERQCAFARSLGYDGLELAPFTLSDEPHRLPPAERARVRRAAEEAGIAITSLHWLLLKPDGLSITSADPDVRGRTHDVIRGLVELCAELGGTTLIHGSPKQRQLDPGDEAGCRERAMEALRVAAEAAEAHGVTYCIEPLAATETSFVTTVEEAVKVVDDIGSPAFATMLDCSAASRGEAEPPAALLERWLPEDRIAHIHLNDANRRGPGEGEDRFAPVMQALGRHFYDRTAAIEPFVYEPDGQACAARSIGYIRGIMEALG